MRFFIFISLSIIQISLGFPLLPLFLFWQSIYSSFNELLFWSIMSGFALAMVSSNLWYWIFLMIVSAFGIFFIRSYIFPHLTPPLISLALFILVLVWHGIDGSRHLEEVVKTTSLYSFLFFIPYAFFTNKRETKSNQRRLF